MVRPYARWALLFSTLVVSSGAFAASASAERAEQQFNEGRRLLAAGQYAAACRAFDASHREEAALGTLLNLADCEERLGKTATAYARFFQAAEWAQREKEDKRMQVARQRAEALRPKLNLLRVEAPPEVLISLDGEAWGPEVRERAVDPGHHVLVASSLAHRPWSLPLEIPAGPSAKTVQVPALVPEVLAADSRVAQADPAQTGSAPAAAVSTTTDEGSRPAAKALIAGGATLLVAGLVGTFYSVSVNDRVIRQQPGGPDAEKPTVTRQQFDTVRVLYPVSLVALAAGAAAASSGVYLLVAPSGASAGLSGTF